MTGRRYRALQDWVRHGQNLEVTCGNGHCPHKGVLEPYDCVRWFKLHRWPDSLEAGALDHFRCSRCGSRAGGARPTEHPVTVTEFFPLHDQAWERLRRRLRG